MGRGYPGRPGRYHPATKGWHGYDGRISFGGGKKDSEGICYEATYEFIDLQK